MAGLTHKKNEAGKKLTDSILEDQVVIPLQLDRSKPCEQSNKVGGNERLVVTPLKTRDLTGWEAKRAYSKCTFPNLSDSGRPR